MHGNHRAKSLQRDRTRQRADKVHSFDFFNQLTSDELFDKVEEGLPEHRERSFPPTLTLSIFMAQLVTIGAGLMTSCVVDSAWVRPADTTTLSEDDTPFVDDVMLIEPNKSATVDSLRTPGSRLAYITSCGLLLCCKPSA